MKQPERILLVCKERDVWPLHHVGKRLREEGYTIAAFFIMPHESMRGDHHYRNFCELNPDIEIFTTEKIGYEYLDAVKRGECKPDYSYMDEVEAQYSYYKPIGLQLISSQLCSSHLHHRSFYPIVSREKQLYFLELHYRHIQKLIKQYHPDWILDVGAAELGRTVLLEIAHKQNIPYISLEHTRYKNYMIPTFCLGVRVEEWFEKTFEQSKKKAPENRHLIQEYRTQKTILASEYQARHHATHLRPLKDLIVALQLFKKTLIKNFSYWKIFYQYVTTPLFADPFQRSLGHILRYIRKVWVVNASIFKRPDLSNISYVYLPLHLIPESSTFTKAPHFHDESSLIQELSKSVKPNQLVLVKEHKTMVGERPLHFYKQINQIPNVMLVDPFWLDDAHVLIENADMVVTITGTSGFEAAMLGVPSITFGPTTYNVLSSVKQITDFTQLPKLIREHGISNEHEKELQCYITTVKQKGVDLRLTKLRKATIGAEDEPVIDDLHFFFKEAFRLHKDSIK